MAQVNLYKLEIAGENIRVTFLCRDNATQFHESLVVSVSGHLLDEGADRVIAVAHQQLRRQLQAVLAEIEKQTPS